MPSAIPAVIRRPFTAIRAPLVSYPQRYPQHYPDPYPDGYPDPYPDGYTGHRVPGLAVLSRLPQLSTLAGPSHAQNRA